MGSGGGFSRKAPPDWMVSIVHLGAGTKPLPILGSQFSRHLERLSYQAGQEGEVSSLRVRCVIDPDSLSLGDDRSE